MTSLSPRYLSNHSETLPGRPSTLSNNESYFFSGPTIPDTTTG